MYQSPIIGGQKFTTSVACTNTATSAPFLAELQNSNKDKERKKPRATSCPLHRKKDLNKLEECYWAQWKPSKTSGVDGKTSSMHSKYLDAPSALGVARFPYIARAGVSGACENCQRLMQNQFMQKVRCQQCFRNFVTHFSSNTDYSDARGDEEQIRVPCMRCNHGFDDTTDCDCKTTGWDSTDRYNGRSGPSTKRSDFGRKQIQTRDKSVGVYCACDGSIKSNGDETQFETGSESLTDARPLYVNKSCFTGSSEMLMRADSNDEVPVKGSPRGTRPSSPKQLPHEQAREEDTFKTEPVQYHCVPYDMEDECCGDSGGSSQARTELVNGQNQTYSIPDSFARYACHCDAEEREKKENQQQDNRSSQSKAYDRKSDQEHQHEQHREDPRQPVKGRDELNCDSDDLTNSDGPNDLFQQMKRLSKYIPAEAKDLVKEMAKIITSEPIQEIKRQAEKILECALEAEGARGRKDGLSSPKASKKQPIKTPQSPTSSIKTMPKSTHKESTYSSPMDSLTSPRPKLSIQMSSKQTMDQSDVNKDCPCCSCLTENPEINESVLLQEQQRVKRQQEQLLVQEQLRKHQQQQLQQQLEDQRKLLEEQAKEIQRQRDLQKKQALLQQQEQQLREQAQAQAARMQQLDAASLRLRLSQELAKETVTAGALGHGKPSQDKNKKPLFSSAVARVTGALRHSYPLAKCGQKKTTKLSKRC